MTNPANGNEEEKVDENVEDEMNFSKDGVWKEDCDWDIGEIVDGVSAGHPAAHCKLH